MNASTELDILVSAIFCDIDIKIFAKSSRSVDKNSVKQRNFVGETVGWVLFYLILNETLQKAKDTMRSLAVVTALVLVVNGFVSVNSLPYKDTM